MKKLITIIVILFSIQSINSQSEDFELLKNIVKDNQLSFTLQMFNILKNCQVYSENFKDESKPVLIKYQRNSLLQEDYWMALVSLTSAKFVFEKNKSLLKDNLSEETFKYLEVNLNNKWPKEITGENIVGMKMNLYYDVLTYHGKKSKIEDEFRIILDLSKLDMGVYKPK